MAAHDENVVWHPHPVTVAQREQLHGHRGVGLWFTGLSGSGKSTLLRILSGLIAPDLGSVMLGDKKISGPNPQINMVFQTFAIFPWLNVYQNIAFEIGRAHV